MWIKKNWYQFSFKFETEENSMNKMEINNPWKFSPFFQKKIQNIICFPFIHLAAYPSGIVAATATHSRWNALPMGLQGMKSYGRKRNWMRSNNKVYYDKMTVFWGVFTWVHSPSHSHHGCPTAPIPAVLPSS